QGRRRFVARLRQEVQDHLPEPARRSARPRAEIRDDEVAGDLRPRQGWPRRGHVARRGLAGLPLAGHRPGAGGLMRGLVIALLALLALAPAAALGAQPRASFNDVE